MFKAAHAREDATLYWHLNDTYIGKTTASHQISLAVAPGTYLLTLIDDEGNQKKIRFEVKE